MATKAAGRNEQPITRRQAQAWLDRWDAQQQAYLPDREDRFTALIDAVEECAGRPDPLVLDLGCGPGSLAVRLLDRMPRSVVVAIDADPVLLALGRAAWTDRPRLRFVDADLRVAGWSAAVGESRQPDAAVSTTALHWLPGAALENLYAELAGVLRPAGLVLNGDHLREDDTAPTLLRLGRALIEREERRRFPSGQAETWSDWWTAAAADPLLAPYYAERQARQVESAHHGSPAGRLSKHVSAMRSAGFAEVGTIWQRGENRLLCGVLPG